MALLTSFQYALDQTGAGERTKVGEGAGTEAHLTCTAEGAGRREADEAQVGAGVVAEEADVAELGEDLGDIRLILEGGASAFENELNLRAYFMTGLYYLLSSEFVFIVFVGFVGEVKWICGEAA